jgi:hypothetical protein
MLSLRTPRLELAAGSATAGTTTPERRGTLLATSGRCPCTTRAVVTEDRARLGCRRIGMRLVLDAVLPSADAVLLSPVRIRLLELAVSARSHPAVAGVRALPIVASRLARACGDRLRHDDLPASLRACRRPRIHRLRSRRKSERARIATLSDDEYTDERVTISSSAVRSRVS